MGDRSVSRGAEPRRTFARERAFAPGWRRPLKIRSVPAPLPRPLFFGHPRLRRTSPIAQYTVAAALEALGPDSAKVSSGELSLGIIVCVMSACVIFSRRFYDETLKDPATASPLVFPETVFNAPASHLAAILGSTGINYTMVGDPGRFRAGIGFGRGLVFRAGESMAVWSSARKRGIGSLPKRSICSIET